jgi:hypothetical protein
MDLYKIWQKGIIIGGKNPALFRKDAYGNQMFRLAYGKDSAQGWSIDHMKPVSKGGSNHLNNLQPMNSKKNKSVGNTKNKKKIFFGGQKS